MKSKSVICPYCSQDSCVDKVSTIYLVGIGLKEKALGPDSQAATINFKLADFPQAELRNLARRLKPPASSRRVAARPLHPDLIVLSFSPLIPIFVFEIYINQVSIFIPVIAFLVAAYGLYIWKRKTLIARFKHRQDSQHAADECVRRGVERWMKLYYCAQDDIVFTPGSQDYMSADRITEIWQSEDRLVDAKDHGKYDRG